MHRGGRKSFRCDECVSSPQIFEFKLLTLEIQLNPAFFLQLQENNKHKSHADVDTRNPNFNYARRRKTFQCNSLAFHLSVLWCMWVRDCMNYSWAEFHSVLASWIDDASDDPSRCLNDADECRKMLLAESSFTSWQLLARSRISRLAWWSWNFRPS